MANKSDLFRLKSELKSLEKHLNIAMSVMKGLEEAEKKAFEEIPGLVGTFDGEYMVTESGEKYPVPSNYAAKSMLLFGDKMKMIEEDGKPFFKNIEKSEPKEVRGILSKKEDIWYILTDIGSYRISDTAAAFNNAQQNIEATALIPSNNPKVPFAALKSVKGGPSNKGETRKPTEVEKSREVKAAPSVVKTKVAPRKAKVVKEDESVPTKKDDANEKKELPKTEQSQTLNLEDDDLR